MTKGPADMDAGIESPFPAEDEQEKDKDSILSYYKMRFVCGIRIRKLQGEP